MSQGSPGYNAAFYATGTSTAMTDEACTEVSTTVFQITNTAKRIFDHDVAVVVKANTVIQSGNYTYDSLFGIVIFTDGSHTGETIVVTGNYLPRYVIAKVRTGTINMSYDSQDSTALGEPGESNTLTLMRFAADIETIQFFADEDLFGSTSLADMHDAKAPYVLECQPTGASYKVIRARVGSQAMTINSGGPADLVSGSLSFVGSHNGAGSALFGYNTI